MISLKELSSYMSSLTSIVNINEVIDLEIVGSEQLKYNRSPVLEWEINSFSQDIVPSLTVTIRFLPKDDLSDLRSIQDIALTSLRDVLNKMRIDLIIPDDDIVITKADINSNMFHGYTFETLLQMQFGKC